MGDFQTLIYLASLLTTWLFCYSLFSTTVPKSVSLRAGLGSILFWSVISAAFIGPGLVTACAIAGSTYELQLLWVLTFATLGTVWLQEAPARITIATGYDLGQIITQPYTGAKGRRIAWALFGAIILGCAACQAGNILGAVAGLALLAGWSQPTLTLLVGPFAGDYSELALHRG